MKHSGELISLLLVLILFVVSLPAAADDDTHQLTFVNNCNQPVWVNVQGGPPGICDHNIDPNTGKNVKCSACSLCPDQSLCNTSVSTGASKPMCCPLITDPPRCWGGQACSKTDCCPGIKQTAGQTYGCPGVNISSANCVNTTLTFTQIADLSGYNNATSGFKRADCAGSIIGGGGFRLAANGGSQNFPVDDGWQGAWFGRTNCSFKNGLGSCETGDCVGPDLWGHLQCGGVGSSAPATKGEMNMDKATGVDWYDVSLVDGFNLPMEITPTVYNSAYVTANLSDHFRCRSAGCLNVTTLTSCPKSLQYKPNSKVVGCEDDCTLATKLHETNPIMYSDAIVKAFCCPDTDYCSPLNPCKAGSTCPAWKKDPSTCKTCDAYNGTYPNGYPITTNLANSARYFHAACPNAYSFTYDDASATYTCNSTPSSGIRTKYNITFCADPNPPVASFTATPLTGTAPLTVRFTDTSTHFPTVWRWTFGDNSAVNATAKNPVHTYTKAGTYTVILNASNEGGNNITRKIGYIRVTGPATPVVGGIVPAAGVRGTAVTVTNLSGSGFISGAAVYLNKTGSPLIPATKVTVVSAKKITCTFTIPANAPLGPRNVDVKNTNGMRGTKVNAFTVKSAKAPTVTGIQPATGKKGAFVRVTNLAGTGFVGSPKPVVQLIRGASKVSATNVTVISANKIQCTFRIPANAVTGGWNVRVTNGDGQAGGKAAAFTVTV